MKKIFIVAAILLLICLCSCSSKTEQEIPNTASSFDLLSSYTPTVLDTDINSTEIQVGMSYTDFETSIEGEEVFRCYEYCFFTDADGKDVVVELGGTPKTIERIERYDHKVASTKDVDLIKPGMSMFELVEAIGLPYTSITSGIFSLNFACYDAFSSEYLIVYFTTDPTTKETIVDTGKLEGEQKTNLFFNEYFAECSYKDLSVGMEYAECIRALGRNANVLSAHECIFFADKNGINVVVQFKDGLVGSISTFEKAAVSGAVGFEQITTGMTISEVVKILGLPSADIPKGLRTLIFRATDKSLAHIFWSKDMTVEYIDIWPVIDDEVTYDPSNPYYRNEKGMPWAVYSSARDYSTPGDYSNPPTNAVLPDLEYTDEGFRMFKDYGNAPLKANMVTQEKQNLREGVSITVREDELYYGGDWGISFFLWDSPNPTLGYPDATYGQGVFFDLVGSATRDGIPTFKQLAFYSFDESFTWIYDDYLQTEAFWSAIELFRDLSAEQSDAIFDENGNAVFNMDLRYDETTNKYSLTVFGIEIDSDAITNYINHRFPDGGAYVGFAVRSSTGAYKGPFSFTMTEFNGITPQGGWDHMHGHEYDSNCDTFCEFCGNKRLIEHSYEEIVTAPTCTEGGYTTYTCSVCGDAYVADETDALGHTFTDATCTVPKTCSVCNTTEGEALGHTWTDATCTTAKTCSVCNATEGEALGHTFVDATCTTAKTCSVCNTTEGEALGHTWADATCTTAKTCSVCNTTEGEALGHTFADATCTTAKTCSVCNTTEGDALGHTWTDATCTTAKTCSVCNTTEGEALGHTFVEATCITAKTCSVCNATEGEALGHTWADATCTTAKTCSVCNATEGEALGHTFADATCTTAKTCSVCNATEGEALGHTFVDATCTTAKTCSVCNTTEGEALGHTYDGETDEYCNICSEKRDIPSTEPPTEPMTEPTTEPVTEKPTDAPDTSAEDSGGCSSSVGFAFIGLGTALAAGCVFSKKKNK